MTQETNKAATRAPRRLIVAVAAAVVAAVAVAIAVALSGGITDGMPQGNGARGVATPTPTATTDPGGIDASEADTGARADAPPVDGSEVQAPGTREDRRTVGVPQLRSAAPVFDGPFPASGAADGALVDGFPDEIAGPFRGDTVIDSAVAVDGDVMQLTLTARSTASAEDVRREMAARWDALGLTPVPADGDAVTYRGTGIALTLTADETGTGTIYSVFAVIQAA